MVGLGLSWTLLNIQHWIWIRSDRSHFFDSCFDPKKVIPAPASELIGNLHTDSCLHSESLKAESI